MLKCHEVTALASDWLDGELTTSREDQGAPSPDDVPPLP